MKALKVFKCEANHQTEYTEGLTAIYCKGCDKYHDTVDLTEIKESIKRSAEKIAEYRNKWDILEERELNEELSKYTKRFNHEVS
jgi:hypothetical protein